MNKWQIETLAGVADTLSNVGRTSGNYIMNKRAMRRALQKNQANNIYNMWEKRIFGDDGYMLGAVNNATEGNFGDFGKYLNDSVWEQYGNIDYIKSIYGDKYSDEVYSLVEAKIAEEGHSKFLFEAQYQAENAERTMLESTFTENLYASIGLKDDNGNYQWFSDNPIDYATSGKESAERMKVAYSSTEAQFEGFDLINNNGKFNLNGKTAITMLGSTGITAGIDQITTDIANKGALVTSEDAEKIIKEWWDSFSETLGMSKSESRALFQANSSLIATTLKQKQQAEITKVNENASKVILMNQGKQLSFTQQLDVYESNGFGDYKSNYYTNSYLTTLANEHYGTNMLSYDRDVINALDYYYTGKGSETIPYIDLGKSYIVGNSIPVSLNKVINGEEYTTQLEDTGSNLVNNINALLDTPLLSEDNAITLNYPDQAMQIAREQGLEDDISFICAIDDIITNKVMFETSENGFFGQYKARLLGVLESDGKTTEEKQANLDNAFAQGFITREEYNEMGKRITFGFNSQLNDINAMLKSDLGNDFYTMYVTRPDAQEFIRTKLEEHKGVITGKEGQTLYKEIKSQIAYINAMDLSNDILTDMFNSMNGNDYYYDGLLQEINGYSVNDIVSAYNNGDMNMFGINSDVDVAKTLISTRSGKISKKNMKNEVLEAIWKERGYEGTYDSSNNENRKQITELIATVAIAQTAQDKNLAYSVGAMLDVNGKSPTNILVTTGTKNLPALISEDGIVVMMVEGAKPTFKIGTIDKEQVAEAKMGLVEFKDIAFEDSAYGLVTTTGKAYAGYAVDRDVPAYSPISFNSDVLSFVANHRGVATTDIPRTSLEREEMEQKKREEEQKKKEEKQALAEESKKAEKNDKLNLLYEKTESALEKANNRKAEEQAKAKDAETTSEAEAEDNETATETKSNGSVSDVVEGGNKIDTPWTGVSVNTQQLANRATKGDLRETDTQQIQNLFEKLDNDTATDDEILAMQQIIKADEDGSIDLVHILGLGESKTTTTSANTTPVPTWQDKATETQKNQIKSLKQNRMNAWEDINTINDLTVLELYFESLTDTEKNDSRVINAYEKRYKKLSK